MGIPLNDRFVFDLKKKFTMIQELFLSKLLERHSIILIVIDSIETYRRATGSVADKESRMLETIGFSV